MRAIQNPDEDLQNLLFDFESVVPYFSASRYESGGKHHLMQHARNHMEERSNCHSKIQYGNKMQ